MKLIRDSNRKQLLHLGILFIAVTALYGRTLSFDFVWDDKIFLVGNEVYSHFNLGKIFSSLANRVEYLPVRDISFAIDYSLWGANPLGFHLTNVLLFFINSVIIYFLAIEITKLFLRKYSSLSEENTENISLAATILFIVHPLNTEAVSFITCRNGLLAGVFFFLSCLLFLFMLTKEISQKRKTLLYIFSILSFILALFSKATSIMLPGILLIFILLNSKQVLKNLLYLVPFCLVAGLAFPFFKEISTSVKTIDMEQVFTFGVLSLSSRLALASQIPYFYLTKLFVPGSFSAEYPDSFIYSFSNLQSLIAFAGILIITIVTLLLRKKQPVFLFSFSWFIIALFPVLNFFSTNPVVADRYAFFAVIAVTYLFSFLLFFVIHKNSLAVIRFSIIFFLAGILSFISFQRSSVWKNDETLWTHTLKDSPASPKAIRNLASSYFDTNPAKAIRFLEEQGEPAKNMLTYFTALNAYNLHDYNGAISVLETVRANYKGGGNFDELCLLADTYQKTGDIQKAIECYIDALKKKGMNDTGIQDYAKSELKRLQNLISPQLDAMRKSIKNNPRDLNTRAKLAVTLEELGMYDEAIAVYTELESLGGANWQLYFNLGNVYSKVEKYDLAISYFQKSIQLNSRFADSYNTLGVAFKHEQKYPQAIDMFKNAMMTDPKLKEAPFNLAALYFRLGDKENALRYFNMVLQEFPELNDEAQPYLEKLK